MVKSNVREPRWRAYQRTLRPGTCNAQLVHRLPLKTLQTEILPGMALPPSKFPFSAYARATALARMASLCRYAFALAYS